MWCGVLGRAGAGRRHLRSARCVPSCAGVPPRAASPTRSAPIDARRAAEEILDRDPDLGAHAQLRDEVEDLLGDAVEFLFKS